MSDYAGIIGRWGTRAAGPAELAQHLGRCFAALAEIDPLFRQWRRDGFRSHSTVPRMVALPPNSAELRAWVAENPEFIAEGGRKQKKGYDVSAETPRGEPLWAKFMLFALDGRDRGRFSNRVSITLFAENGHEARLAPLIRPVLLALATAFDCDWVGADPAHYATPAGPKAGAGMVRYESGGMVYLAASHAAKINAPADIGIERLPSGAMLLTAAAIFDRKNPEHRAAAYRIQQALAPLNS